MDGSSGQPGIPLHIYTQVYKDNPKADVICSQVSITINAICNVPCRVAFYARDI